MIALSDAQLKIVMAAAAQVPIEKRSQFLQRIAAMLAIRGYGHFNGRRRRRRGGAGAYEPVESGSGAKQFGLQKSPII
jgi:hypothetical protein